MTDTPSLSSSPSLGELQRTMTALRDDLRSTRHELEKLHDARTEIALHTQRLDSHRHRIENLESSLTWVVRLVIGLVLAAVVALAMTAGGTDPAETPPGDPARGSTP